MAIIAAITAAAAAAGAGAGIYGAASANSNAAKARQQSGQAAMQTAENNDQYQKMLNAIAMNRSTAGTIDAQGNQLTYDPATNTWRTTLSGQGQRTQQAFDNANVSRNTTDMRTQQGANDREVMQSLLAQRAADPALRAVQNFKPMTADELTGDLTQQATTANRSVQDPIIADTLRTFARTGTAAGPVLEQLQRSNAGELRKSMIDSRIAALTNVDQINNQRRSGLTDAYTALRGAGKPSLGFSPIATDNPNSTLSQLMSTRAAGAATPASQGAYSSSGSTNAMTGASQLAGNTVADSNAAGAKLMSLGSQFKDLGTSGVNLYKSLFGSGQGGTGQPAAIPGYSNSTGFGYTPPSGDDLNRQVNSIFGSNG